MKMKRCGLMALALSLSACSLAPVSPQPAPRTPESTRMPAPVVKPVPAPPAQLPPLELPKEQQKQMPAPVISVRPKPQKPAVEQRAADDRSEVTQELLAGANLALEAGDFEQAAIQLEQALRISPKNGSVWLQLAHVRQQQGRCDESRQLARKARQLGIQGNELKEANLLLEHCEQMGTRVKL